MSDVFARRLQELGGVEKEGLVEALATGAGPALVRSAFELPLEQRATIQHALNTYFSAEVRVQFEVAPDLISGIELSVNGRSSPGASRVTSRRWRGAWRTCWANSGQLFLLT